MNSIAEKDKESNEALRECKIKLEEYENRDYTRKSEMKLLISELEQIRAANFELKEFKRVASSPNKSILLGEGGRGNEKEIVKLKQQYEDSQIECNDLKTRIETLENDLTNQIMEIEKKSQLNIELDRLVIETKRSNDIIISLNSEKDHLCNALSATNSQLSDERIRSELFKTQLKELNDQLHAIEMGNNFNDPTIALLNEQKIRLKAKIEELETKLESSEEQCRQQKRELARLYEDSITLYEKLKLVENTKSTSHRKSYINPLIIMHKVVIFSFLGYYEEIAKTGNN